MLKKALVAIVVLASTTSFAAEKKMVKPAEKDAKNPLVQGGPPPRPPMRVLSLIGEKTAPVVGNADITGLLDQLDSLRQENEKLKEELAAVQRAPKNVMASASSPVPPLPPSPPGMGGEPVVGPTRHHESQQATQAASLTSGADRASKNAHQNSITRLLTQLDQRGGEVFLTGVGPTRMFEGSGRVAFRFAAADAPKADAMFSSKGASRFERADFVYYVVSSDLLQR